ncbi:MAG TPA: DUF308 domain-containing protein [Candidatus Sulfotelmatobacter sp.]|nr:DUF308 domain-containing protein [Candidatus Sulfotelmatobacter sp.]
MSVASTSVVPIVKSYSGWSIALSVLMILAGTAAIILPPVAGIVTALFFGWLLIFGGGAHLLYGWHTRSRGGLVWELILGAVYIAAGIYLLLHPVVGLASLTLALGIYLGVESILEFVLSYQFRLGPGWGWLLIDGIITMFLAALIFWTWPWNIPWVIGTLVGISMLFSGVARLVISLAARRLGNELA